MVYTLLSSLPSLGMISLSLLITNAVNAKPTEYVFSAPQETNQELGEIPTSEKEYPLYECNQETENNSEEVLIDSHNCECVDCQNNSNSTQDAAKNEQLNSEK